jgi:hypothetical protein
MPFFIYNNQDYGGFMMEGSAKNGTNSKLINWSYIISVLAFLGGLYFIYNGYSAAFIALVPGLACAPYLLYRGEFRYGIVLLALIFLWIITYIIYYPGQLI